MMVNRHMKLNMIEIRTPQTHSDNYTFWNKSKTTIFLAGSIENGVAEDWQTKLIQDVSKKFGNDDIIIFNPRRADWNPNAKMDANDEYFKHQVEWELHHLRCSRIKIFYFADDTVSPITLLELGAIVSANNYHKDKLIVRCSDKYFRKGNVDVTLEHFQKNTAVNTYDEMLSKLDTQLENIRYA